jgi:glycosyltransferase involved in cell wall biosynthesis
MSIVLLIRSLNYGGTERQLVELAKGLHRAGHRVVVIAFYAGGPLLSELKDGGVKVVGLDKKGRWDVVRFLPRLVRLLRELRPQVVYSFLVEPNIVAVSLKPLLSKTRIVWGVRASNMAFGWYDWFSRLNFHVSRGLARCADLIIANSWSGAEYHKLRGYPAATIAVVPNGIDTERFRPDIEAGRKLRAEWGIADGQRVIGVIGRHDPIKDHGTCFEALGILQREQMNLRLVCVGSELPDQTSPLRAMAETLNITDVVTWVAPRREMTSVYNALDVVCSSSVSEGFPNVLAEAMACGVPCVATDVGDTSRILGDCGVVVPPRDSRRLANGIRQALLNAGPDKARACRERIAREFSLERMVQETERLLRAQIDAPA